MYCANLTNWELQSVFTVHKDIISGRRESWQGADSEGPARNQGTECFNGPKRIQELEHQEFEIERINQNERMTPRCIIF